MKGEDMATKKQGVLVVKTDWVKHLRKTLKKRFWHKHRQAEKKVTKTDD